MSRKIYLTGEIHEQAYLDFAKQLDELETASVKPIKLVINSLGGSMYDALAIVGLIQNSQAPIHAVVFGVCMSSATLVLAVCDERSAAASAWFMVHSSMSRSKGFLEDRTRELQHEDDEQTAWCALMAKNTNVSVLAWKVYEKNRTYFDAQKALELGLINYILE